MMHRPAVVELVGDDARPFACLPKNCQLLSSTTTTSKYHTQACFDTSTPIILTKYAKHTECTEA